MNGFYSWIHNYITFEEDEPVPTAFPTLRFVNTQLATLSGARSDDLDRVLIAIQQAGYSLGREAPDQAAGRISVQIAVRAP